MSRSELRIRGVDEFIAKDHREHGTLHARKQLQSVAKLLAPCVNQSIETSNLGEWTGNTSVESTRSRCAPRLGTYKT
jgi:hypothetical protein